MAARELVGGSPCLPLGAGDTHPGQHIQRSQAGRGPGHPAVSLQHFPYLLPYPAGRGQGPKRILEDHPHLPAPEVGKPGATGRQHVDPRYPQTVCLHQCSVRWEEAEEA